MSAPFFSVITAIKNGLELFRETVPTMLAQTERDFEWLVVDDGSTEPLGDWLASLRDPRVRILRNEQSKGQTYSLNLAIANARADWLVRMDGDDLAAPTRLERLRQAIERAPRPSHEGFAPLVFSDYSVIHEDGGLVSTVRYRPEPAQAFFDYLRHRNNPLCHPTVAFYKFAPDGSSYAYDERLRNAQDYELWKRIYGDYQRPFAHVAEPLVSYRLVRSSLSGMRINEQKNDLDAIRRHDASKRDARGDDRRLSSTEQEGMYAYRVLFYRCLGEVPSELASSAWDALWLLRAARYPRVLPRAAAYAAARAAGGPARRALLHGIFI